MKYFLFIGRLLGELTSPQDRAGLGMVKIVIIVVNLIAVGIHVAAYFFDNSSWPLLIYIRNQFSGLSLLLCCIQVRTTHVWRPTNCID